jgi:hypothetical protein
LNIGDRPTKDATKKNVMKMTNGQHTKQGDIKEELVNQHWLFFLSQSVMEDCGMSIHTHIVIVSQHIL